MSESTTRKRGLRGLVRRGMHWPICVAVVFLGNMALATWVIIVANSDPSFAVERDYYDKAVNWNDEIDQRRRNEALGWRVSLGETPALDGSGALSITLDISDAEGAPIDGAAVSVVAIPIARGDAFREVRLEGVGGGRYGGRVEGARAGRWEIRVEVRRGGDRFTHRLGALVEGVG